MSDTLTITLSRQAAHVVNSFIAHAYGQNAGRNGTDRNNITEACSEFMQAYRDAIAEAN